MKLTMTGNQLNPGAESYATNGFGTDWAPAATEGDWPEPLSYPLLGTKLVELSPVLERRAD